MREQSCHRPFLRRRKSQPLPVSLVWYNLKKERVNIVFRQVRLLKGDGRTLPEALSLVWGQEPPRPLISLMTSVTSPVTGEPLEVWQVTPF